MKQENIFATFEKLAKESGKSTLIEMPNGSIYTYEDMLKITENFATTLSAKGVRSGDRVVTQIEKSVEALFLYLAVLRTGAIYVPLNTAYKLGELEYFLQDAQPTIFICAPEGAEEKIDLANRSNISIVFTLSDKGTGTFLDAAATQGINFPTANRSSEEVATIIYTSGTTGKPKGAMLTHANLLSNGQALKKLWGFTSKDVLLHALPLFHAHGLFISTHCTLLSQSSMIFLPKFKAEEVVSFLPKSTVMAGVPTFYARLLALSEFTKNSARNMRVFISGSAPLLPETAQDFENRTGHKILERYGMTESAIIASNPFNGERRIGSVGKPIDGVEVRIVGEDGNLVLPDDVGEIQVKGSGVMKGYWRKPEKTKEDMTSDGWFKTGDLGILEKDGYLKIVGREKDMIISGGYNVYPKEVEMVIDEISGVNESAVIGVPDSDFGEAVIAIVVTDNPVDSQLIIKRAKEELANYKVPKNIFFVKELPRNAMGKVLKNELRDKFKNKH